MRMLSYLARFMNYYQKRGFLRTISRIYEQPNRIIFKGQMLLFYAEMNEVNDSALTLPPNIIIVCKSTYNEAVQPDMQMIINYWKKENLMDNARERFGKGAILWIVKLNKDIAGFVWSIRGKMVSPWYLPLTFHDAVLFDCVIFEEYRGRGLYPRLMNYLFGKLKLDGVSRVFGFSYAWNKSSIRGLEKTHYHKFSEARKFRVLGRNVTIWSQ
jgi:GNAT superfamily N-acetyltransferase